ncbi:heme-binding protein [Streptomyces sp. NPDC059479]|uniref:GlcG/HbpS family heme-binding protein n=1 Tax=Streptomyces sp. NPDC059479 TaxID=3346848 RepID=UPI0036A59B8F
MLTFDIALRLATAALAEGAHRGANPLTVAVLDAGGHQVVLHRQDGCGIVRPQIAIGKAWGALGLGFSSRGIAAATQRFPEFFNALAVASEGRTIPAPGGVLLRAPGEGIVGAIGVSGDSSDVDEACAIAAARAVSLEPEPATPAV